MKMKTQLEVMKSVRKPAVPPTRILRPLKGCGYRRPRNGREFSE